MTPTAPSRHIRRSKGGVLHWRPRPFFLGAGCRLDGMPPNAGLSRPLNCVETRPLRKTHTCGCVNAPPLFAAQSSASRNAYPAKRRNDTRCELLPRMRQRALLGVWPTRSEPALNAQQARRRRDCSRPGDAQPRPENQTPEGASRPTRAIVGIGPDRPINQGASSRSKPNFAPSVGRSSY